MSSFLPHEIHLLLDSAGALIVFQEKGAAWAGVLAFSSEDKAREFCRVSNLDAAEVAAISGHPRRNLEADTLPHIFASLCHPDDLSNARGAMGLGELRVREAGSGSLKSRSAPCLRSPWVAMRLQL